MSGKSPTDVLQSKLAKAYEANAALCSRLSKLTALPTDDEVTLLRKLEEAIRQSSPANVRWVLAVECLNRLDALRGRAP